MKHAALFRNVNLGHPGCPSGANLEEAFGGPGRATSFQTNGTVVFEADDPATVAERARARLAEAGFTQPFVVRSFPALEATAADAPPVDPADDIYRMMVSFHDLDERPPLEVPMRSPNGLVEVRLVTDTHSWSACWKPRSTAGNASGFLESLLGVPVTSRTSGTLERLLRAHGAARPSA